jgi:hypothetical protein
MPQNRKHLEWIHHHPSQSDWDPVMRHMPTPDMVGATEKVAKHAARGQGQRGWELCPS